MTDITNLYEYLRKLDDDIDQIYWTMDLSTEIVNMTEEVVRTTRLKSIYSEGLDILLKWHKTRDLNSREKLRELYVYRDSITDNIQYYNMNPVESRDSITQVIDF